jgi:cell division protein ZipA
MEGFVRISLLIIGIVIVSLILFESVVRKRLIRRALKKNINHDNIPTIDPDLILGLDPREPTINLIQPPKKVIAKPAPAPLPPLEAITPIEIADVYAEPPILEMDYDTDLPDEPRSSEFIDKLLIISVVAKPDQPFASYDLLQSISATGMQFGDMNIFHYNVETEEFGRIALFSLAAATEPGEFNIDNMGDFSCPGLTLFMSLSEVPDAEQAFELMLKTAEQLADDLNGELRAGLRIPWTDETLYHYQQKILQCLSMKQV